MTYFCIVTSSNSFFIDWKQQGISALIARRVFLMHFKVARVTHKKHEIYKKNVNMMLYKNLHNSMALNLENPGPVSRKPAILFFQYWLINYIKIHLETKVWILLSNNPGHRRIILKDEAFDFWIKKVVIFL